MSPAMSGNVGPDCDGSFMPRMFLNSGLVRSCQVLGNWLADIYVRARLRLNALGIPRIYGGDRCTYTNPGQFFSYRRDGATGRMGTLIWIAG